MSEGSATGGCRCGKVRFALAGAPMLTAACHCRECQHMTGGAFSLSSGYARDALTIIEGEDQLVLGGAQQSNKHWHCAFCKSWLYTEPQGIENFVNVRTPMLDAPPQEPPFVETFRAEGFPWAETGAARTYAALPEMHEWPLLIQAFTARR